MGVLYGVGFVDDEEIETALGVAADIHYVLEDVDLLGV